MRQHIAPGPSCHSDHRRSRPTAILRSLLRDVSCCHEKSHKNYLQKLMRRSKPLLQSLSGVRAAVWIDQNRYCPKHKKAVHAKATPALPGLAEWIEANIILPNTVAEPGAMHLWPWQRGLAEAIGDPTVERVTLMKATRLGFSSLLTAAIGYFCVVKPSTILYLLPTEADARGFVVDDVEPLFECTPVLQRQLMSPAIARHDRNTMLHRLWPGGSLKVVAGKAPEIFAGIRPVC